MRATSKRQTSNRQLVPMSVFRPRCGSLQRRYVSVKGGFCEGVEALEANQIGSSKDAEHQLSRFQLRQGWYLRSFLSLELS